MIIHSVIQQQQHTVLYAKIIKFLIAGVACSGMNRRAKRYLGNFLDYYQQVCMPQDAIMVAKSFKRDAVLAMQFLGEKTGAVAHCTVGYNYCAGSNFPIREPIEQLLLCYGTLNHRDLRTIAIYVSQKGNILSWSIQNLVMYISRYVKLCSKASRIVILLPVQRNLMRK